MGYVIGGFLLVVAIEGFIGITERYKRVPRHRQPSLKVSMPWYGWGLAVYAATKKRSEK